MSEEVRAEVIKRGITYEISVWALDRKNPNILTGLWNEKIAENIADAINNYAELKENWNKATAELLVVKLTIVEKDAEIAKLQEKYEEVGAKFVLMGIENEDLKHKVDVTMEYLNKKE
jgi:chromosome segregation ATPase